MTCVLSVCEVFCGLSEPLLADVYTMVLTGYRTLVFSQPIAHDAAPEATLGKLNFKRMQRESRRLVENTNAVVSVREATREERALQKAKQEAEAKAEREAQAEYKYQRKQEQKKAKQRGR